MCRLCSRYLGGIGLASVDLELNLRALRLFVLRVEYRDTHSQWIVSQYREIAELVNVP